MSYYVLYLYNKSVSIMYLDNLSKEQEKEFVSDVIARLKLLHGVHEDKELNDIYDFPKGTIGNIVKNAAISKRLLSMCLTACIHFGKSLDYIFLGKEPEAEDLANKIKNGLFMAHDVGYVHFEKFEHIDLTADLILEDVSTELKKTA